MAGDRAARLPEHEQASLAGSDNLPGGQIRAPSLLSEKYPAGRPLLRLDGADFHQLFRSAYAWLERNHESVNALNVFPVPDGDTGTNMLLTLQSSFQEIEAQASERLDRVFQAAAHGALMGARGNSGVILSQILRGMAAALADIETCDAYQFARALRLASDTAYKGVLKPVEGTILTVIRLTADAAERAAQLDSDLRFLFGRAVHAAGDAVEKTPGMLPVLAQAGVVDAGGKGLYFVLDGMFRALRGEAVEQSSTHPALFAGHAEALDGEYGFDIQFIVQGSNLDVDAIRDTISRMGDSVLVVGDSQTVKVHLHAPEPGHALNYGAGLGHMSRIIVENMDAQFEEFVHGEGEGDGPLAGRAAALILPAAADAPAIATVAVVPGTGLQQVFQSLGTSRIISGGQTMNPSTQEILAAIEDAPAQQVIVLTNNSNIILAGQQAVRLSNKQVRLVPSKTIPQGISALIAFNPQADLDENVAAMDAALAAIQTGEITIAVRSATFDGIDVAAGDIIGLLNDQLTTHGNDFLAVARDLLVQMQAGSADIITIYYGASIAPDDAQALLDALAGDYPQQEFELIGGDQPHYQYIISAE